MERFSKRKDRRKPKGRQRVAQLYAATGSAKEEVFAQPALQTLYERGFLLSIDAELKSGKEATVYLGEGPEGLLAVKIYRDLTVRSFKADQRYRNGRFVADARIKKAINQRSLNGLHAQQAMWVLHEYLQLWQLYRAGIAVPKPMIGPDSDDLVMAGSVVLMELIGDETMPAPRLSDLRLSAEEAESAWQQSLQLYRALLKLGKIHGDFSTYNLLWWQGRIVVIDFPQMNEIAESPNAKELILQDVTSLCKSFKRHGIRVDPASLYQELLGQTDIASLTLRRVP